MTRRTARLLFVLPLIALSSTSLIPAQTPRPSVPTFTGDIAPIVFEQCASCHRPGGTAPFSLLTYADVRLHARQVADATRRRYMPPWKPVAGFGGPFVGERRLSDAAIETIGAWIDGDMVEGDPADLPPVPEQPAGWRLGTPDLIVTMPEAYTLPTSGPDMFRNFVLPVPIAERKYIAALEFRPGSSHVHHAILRIDQTSSARDLDAADPGPGYDGMLIDRSDFPDGHFLGWTPGKRPTVTPEGLAWALNPGSDLVLQVHVMPMGMRDALKAEVGLYFADTPPVRTPALVRLSSSAIDVPPGEPAYVVEDRYVLPVPVNVLAAYPHTHYLGHRVESFAQLPDGSTRWLLRIDDWDFNWQDEYRYAIPVPLPAAATVVMRYTLDNSAGNPRNPHKPPARVTYGQQSTDEMAELTLQVLPTNPADLSRLTADMARKLRTDNIEGFRTLIARNPTDHVSHTALGVRYLEDGNVAQAIAQLEEAVRLNPRFASAHNSLGTALLMRGRTQEALTHYARAIELEPNNAGAHNNLGSVLQSMGRVAEAEQQYRQAITFQPRHSGAHYNLANVLQMQDRFDEAIVHYRLALAIAPDVADTHGSLARTLTFQGKRSEAIVEYREALLRNPNLVTSLADLAWLLATSPEEALRRPTEAVQLAEHAVALTRRSDMVVLDRLAAAYAADGRYDQAVDAARTAVTLARQANDAEFAGQVQQRLQQYQQRRPFRMEP